MTHLFNILTDFH